MSRTAHTNDTLQLRSLIIILPDKQIASFPIVYTNNSSKKLHTVEKLSINLITIYLTQQNLLAIHNLAIINASIIR